MHTRKPGTRKQPFPLRRPTVIISQRDMEPFSIDCPELRWWFIVPKKGERALYADYAATDWKLSEVHEMEVTRPATVHDVECVEMTIHTWHTNDGWTPSAWQMYGRMTAETAEYLAVSQIHDGKKFLYTFLDKDFDIDWGQMPRKLEDGGHCVTQADGSLKLLHGFDDSVASGAGVFSVSIAGRRFTCLRVLELGTPLDSHDTHQTVSYVTEAGRTVLVRHFCRPEKAMLNEHGKPENVVVDNDLQIVIDGVTLAHWYDSFSNLAFGF